MNKSESIVKIAKALLAAQKEMGDAVKNSKNPFLKNSYSDLNSVREASIPVLNANGIVVLQPTVMLEGKNYVETLLLHESGEYISGMTEIVNSKPNDAQAQGSGVTYARRYGLQSAVNIGSVDDDGNAASQPTQRMPVGNSNQTATGAKVPMTEAIFNSTKAAMTAAKSDPTMRSPKDTLEAAKKAMDIQANWLTELELLAK